MADTRVADLTESGPPADEDLLYLVDVSAGPPRDRKVTVANLAEALGPNFPADTRAVDIYYEATTTDATPTVMTATDTIVAHDGITLLYIAYVVARQDGAPHAAAAYKIEGSAVRDIGSPGIELHSAIFKTAYEEDDPSWNVTVAPAGIPLTLDLIVTGAAATTIRWFAHVHVVEVQVL